MQYQSKQPDENLIKAAGGIIYFYEDKPTDEGQVGVYQEDGLWMVAHMRERGELFKLGEFDNKEQAINKAQEYINLLKEWGI